jgi:hypothetical protein
MDTDISNTVTEIKHSRRHLKLLKRERICLCERKIKFITPYTWFSESGGNDFTLPTSR